MLQYCQPTDIQMLDKHQQNLDTFKEYLKGHDLSIRLSDFEPKYSLNDEKTVLRFMCLSAVLGYDKPAFEKFAEFVDSQGADLIKTVKRFVRDVKLEVSQLPSVTATVSGKGDLLVKRKSSAKTGYAWLFCYGSNGLTQLEERLERNDFEFYPAVLMKSKLVFAGNSKHWGGGVAAVQEDDKAFVIGAVVKVSKRDLTTLDTYEGVSRSIYTRVHVNVSAFVSPDNNQRSRAKAIMYNRVDVIEGTFTLNKPSIKYQHAINKARKEFWADHLDKLKILRSRLAAIEAESEGAAGAVGSNRTWATAVSSLVDPRLFSDKVVRKKISDLAKLIVQAHKYFANYTTRSQSYFDEAAKEWNYLLTTATYRTGFLSIQQKVRSLLYAVEDDFAEYAYKKLGIREQDLNEVASDASSLEYLMQYEPDEPETKAFHDWARLLEFKKKAEEKLQYFDTIQKSVTMESTETLFHASLYASELAKNGWSAAGDRTGLGAFGKQQTVSFTYSLVYAQQIFQFFIAAWMVANKKMSVDRVAALFKTKRETYYKPMRAGGILDFDTNIPAKDKYQAKDQGLNEFLNFVRMHEIGVNWLAVFNQETLYKQLRSIPVTSIGIVKCVVETEGAEHVPGEWEIRVKPEAIKSTILVTKGSG